MHSKKKKKRQEGGCLDEKSLLDKPLHKISLERYSLAAQQVKNLALHCCGVDSTLGLGTSTCHRCNQKEREREGGPSSHFIKLDDIQSWQCIFQRYTACV